jgi:L-arabinokinase
VISGLPPDFFNQRLGCSGYRHREAAFDVGIVQRDSIRMDLDATLRKLLELSTLRTNNLAAEMDYIRAARAGLVVADIPGLPLAAARAAGVPGVAVSNFSWDWIYDAYRAEDPRWDGIIAQYREDYYGADLLLELPFACDMPAFRRRETLKLLADPGRDRRAEIARDLGVSTKAKWVLVAFAALDWDEPALRSLEAISDCEFFVLQPLCWSRRNMHVVDRKRFPFPDVLASCDAVVSKPGYGIVSECVANGKPLVYADRGTFREAPVLVDSIRRYLRSCPLSAQRLYDGDLADAIHDVLRQPAPTESMPGGGADQAAECIGKWF